MLLGSSVRQVQPQCLSPTWLWAVLRPYSSCRWFRGLLPGIVVFAAIVLWLQLAWLGGRSKGTTVWSQPGQDMQLTPACSHVVGFEGFVWEAFVQATSLGVFESQFLCSFARNIKIITNFCWTFQKNFFFFFRRPGERRVIPHGSYLQMQLAIQETYIPEHSIFLKRSTLLSRFLRRDGVRNVYNCFSELVPWSLAAVPHSIVNPLIPQHRIASPPVCLISFSR